MKETFASPLDPVTAVFFSPNSFVTEIFALARGLSFLSSYFLTIISCVAVACNDNALYLGGFGILVVSVGMVNVRLSLLSPTVAMYSLITSCLLDSTLPTMT